MRTVKCLSAAIVSVVAVGVIGTAHAAMAPVFGPVYVEGSNCRHEGKKTGDYTFTAPVPGKGILVVKTWKSPDTRDNRRKSNHDARIEGAKIELNDQRIVRSKDFKKDVQVLNLDIDLLASNELEVKFETCKKCEIEISVLGEAAPAPTPPVIGIGQESPLGIPR